MNQLFTRDSLIQYLLEHQKNYPEKGHYVVEMRSNLLAAVPHGLQHDDTDQVIILIGVPYK